jgi:hypothetical protein
MEGSKLSGVGQNARDWLEKYSNDGRGGTKEEIAAARAKLVRGLSGKLTYEDMRQLGAYTDDITTVGAGAPPAPVTTRFRPVKLEDVPRPVPKATGDVVEAPPAFPGQQSAKGATKARFRDVAERNAKALLDKGEPEAAVKDRLVKMFKVSPDDADEIVNAARPAPKPPSAPMEQWEDFQQAKRSKKNSAPAPVANKEK